MTTDEKKHFILDIIVNTPDKTRFDTSFIASVLGLEISDVNNLCRDLISQNDLKDSTTLDNVGTLTVVCFTQGADSFNTAKYLHLNSIDNIEFEVLNFLYYKSISTQTRINHILVSSSLTVFETTEALALMVDNGLIKVNDTPQMFRYTNDNKLIDNHVLAFENIHRPIKANITTQGKTYFKQQYMDNDKPHQTFNGPTNYISGNNHGQQTLLTNQTNNDQQVEKKTLIHKIWNLISENKLVTGIILLIVAAVINSISNNTKSPNNNNVNSNKSDTVLKTP